MFDAVVAETPDLRSLRVRLAGGGQDAVDARQEGEGGGCVKVSVCERSREARVRRATPTDFVTSRALL